MTLIEQQRFIGIGLLLLLISVVAFFLIAGANEHHQAELEQVSRQAEDLASLVEPVDLEPVDDVFAEQEAFVDLVQPAASSPKDKVAPEGLPVVNQLEVEPEIQILDTKTRQVVKPEEKIMTSPERWTAQLGSFSQKENAHAFAEKVKSKGYHVELLTGQSGNKTLYRVRLQSEADKTSIELKAETLIKTMNLNPQVFKINQ